MLTVRLAKSPTKGSGFFRMVVLDRRLKNNGKTTDRLGFWDKPLGRLQVDRERLAYWQSKGAQLSAAVKKLLSEHEQKKA